MTAQANTIIDALVTAIAADHSAGTGTYDLSGAGLVDEGVSMDPPVDAIAVVRLMFPDFPPVVDHVDLDTYHRSMSLQVMLWAKSANTAAARRAAILELYHDVTAAIETAVRGATLNGTCTDVTCTGPTVDGDEQDLAPGYGTAVFDATVFYPASRGI